MNGDEDESGATATAVLVGDDMLLISHLGDSSVVCVLHPCTANVVLACLIRKVFFSQFPRSLESLGN